MSAKFDVFGMCNPLYDIQAEVAEDLFAEFGLAKGSMNLVGLEDQRQMLPKLVTHVVNSAAGGSGANTVIGVAQLGGTACYTGHVGTDEHSQLYRDGLESLGIRANLGSSEGDTGVCMVLITPDTQRTMCTYLGNSRELNPADVNSQDIGQSKYIYVTGYLWDTEAQKEAVVHAMQEANRFGVKVALSLSDPFCVQRHRDDFQQLISSHVSVIFGNRSEAMELTGTSTPMDAALTLAKDCDLAAVTLDDEGSILVQGDVVLQIPVYPVKAVDATGAGDAYAAGLLFGLARELPLENTGRLASYFAAQVVAHLGPRLNQIDEHVVAKIMAGVPFERL